MGMPASLASVECTLMRGGTSRGPFFNAEHLPRDHDELELILTRIMGSGHPLQIDGIGGGNPLTSKVAIVSKSSRPGIDLEYLFAQVDVNTLRIDTQPNCGNMLSAVGPFGLDEGLVLADGEVTKLTILNANTGSIVCASIQTPGGQVCYEGATSIPGVPGTAAPIELRFVDAAGSKTGALLPTGVAAEMIDGIEVSCVDMAMPIVFIAARSLNLTARESADDLSTNSSLMAKIEHIRLEAGRRMGLGDVSASVIPKVVIFASRSAGGVVARYFMPWQCHTAFAATGAICTAAAAGLADTILAREVDGSSSDFTIEHPSGLMPLKITHTADGRFESAAIVRTARPLLKGRALYVRSPRN